MWRLIKEQLRGRWLRPVGIAVLIGLGVGSWEYFYQGRPPGAWQVTFLWMVLSGVLLPFSFVELESRERRAAMLKALPVSTLAIAISRVLVPVLMFLPVLLVALVASLSVGADLPLFSAPSTLVVWSLLLLAFESVAALWSELKPRLLQVRYGKVLYFGLPMFVGACCGALFAVYLEGDETGTWHSVAEAMLGGTTAAVAAAIFVLFSGITVSLFMRRATYL